MCVCVCVCEQEEVRGTKKERKTYQKAVKLKKLEVVAMEAIDPAANTHCEILRRSPVKVPGVPGKSFIFFLLQNEEVFRFSMGLIKYPSLQIILNKTKQTKS